ncbi:hypothetical protein, partial [Bartonella birtlesii]
MSLNEILPIALVVMLFISAGILRFAFSYREQVKDLKEEAKKKKNEFLRETVELTHERDAAVKEQNRAV